MSRAIRDAVAGKLKTTLRDLGELALFVAGRYQEAFECTEKALRENPSVPGIYRLRTACLSQLGRVDDANAALADFLRLVLDANVASTKAQIPRKRPELSDQQVAAATLQPVQFNAETAPLPRGENPLLRSGLALAGANVRRSGERRRWHSHRGRSRAA
jgi:tetratricopeptide (TPR) repeat protein